MSQDARGEPFVFLRRDGVMEERWRPCGDLNDRVGQRPGAAVPVEVGEQNRHPGYWIRWVARDGSSHVDLVTSIEAASGVPVEDILASRPPLPDLVGYRVRQAGTGRLLTGPDGDAPRIDLRLVDELVSREAVLLGAGHGLACVNH